MTNFVVEAVAGTWGAARGLPAPPAAEAAAAVRNMSGRMHHQDLRMLAVLGGAVMGPSLLKACSERVRPSGRSSGSRRWEGKKGVPSSRGGTPGGRVGRTSGTPFPAGTLLPGRSGCPPPGSPLPAAGCADRRTVGSDGGESRAFSEAGP